MSTQEDFQPPARAGAQGTDPKIAPRPPCPHDILKKGRTYRFGTAAGVIGYIFLIPSIVGLLIGLVGWFGANMAAGKATSALDHEARSRMEARGIPEPIIAKVLANEWLNDDDRSKLTHEQEAAVDQYKTEVSVAKSGADVGSFLVGGVLVFAIIASLFGGAIGWILTLRKDASRCGQCGALVAGSREPIGMPSPS